MPTSGRVTNHQHAIQLRFLSWAGTRTSEENTGTIEATGTAPHTATIVPICAKRFHRRYSELSALLNRHYRGISTVQGPGIRAPNHLNEGKNSTFVFGYRLRTSNTISKTPPPPLTGYSTYKIHLIKRYISLHSCQISSPSETGFIVSAHRLTKITLLTLIATL